MNTTTADLGAQLADQRDKLAETVGSLAGKIDTAEIRGRAEAGASELLDSAATKDGKRGLLLGIVGALAALFIARRLLG